MTHPADTDRFAQLDAWARLSPAPLLRSVTINVDVDGRPVEFGTSWFSGDRVTLTVVPE